MENIASVNGIELNFLWEQNMKAGIEMGNKKIPQWSDTVLTLGLTQNPSQERQVLQVHIIGNSKGFP